MSCHKKNGKDGHDGHDGEHGKHGKRGKRGHKGCQGPIGFPGATGPTGPCCTGPTGPTGPCNTPLFAQLLTETCTSYDETPDFSDLVCLCFSLTKPSTVNIYVSLSASLTAPPPPSVDEATDAQVLYRLYDSVVGPLTGSQAGSESHVEGSTLVGNAINLQATLGAGDHTICVQWKTVGAGQSVCIDPAGEDSGTHASLIIESCDTLTPCE